jgi:ABC-type phosphate transport system substrate-binding protein
VKNNEIFTEARDIIAHNTGCVFYNESRFKSELEKFALFKIETIGQLESLIINNKKHYLSFVNELTKDINESVLSNSLPLFYFQHFLACSKETEEFIEEYFNYGATKIGGEDYDAKGFIRIYNNSK